MTRLMSRNHLGVSLSDPEEMPREKVFQANHSLNPMGG